MTTPMDELTAHYTPKGTQLAMAGDDWISERDKKAKKRAEADMGPVGNFVPSPMAALCMADCNKQLERLSEGMITTGLDVSKDRLSVTIGEPLNATILNSKFGD